LKYCHAVWYGKKLEWLSYPVVKNFENTIARFDTIHECDGHTHRQTPHDGIGCAYAYHCAEKILHTDITVLKTSAVLQYLNT